MPSYLKRKVKSRSIAPTSHHHETTVNVTAPLPSTRIPLISSFLLVGVTFPSVAVFVSNCILGAVLERGRSSSSEGTGAARRHRCRMESSASLTESVS